MGAVSPALSVHRDPAPCVVPTREGHKVQHKLNVPDGELVLYRVFPAESRSSPWAWVSLLKRNRPGKAVESEAEHRACSRWDLRILAHLTLERKRTRLRTRAPPAGETGTKCPVQWTLCALCLFG